MPTQEERITALEQTLAKSQKETNANIVEIDENTTILLGVIRRQGQDIRRISEHLSTIDEQLATIEQRLNRLETKSDEHIALLREHTTRCDRLETLLTQVLTRLPEAP